ncbi:MAG: IS110 family transposase [Serratia marcescens]|uniref:IS110 family transposase n=1 Tax=Serratia marcescens TaxID=615 RepID=UPI0013D8F90C|nr:IS110 family transposase [Serratia marcescens]MDU7806269.1 IS110 family transposase [Serratia marcescens]BEN88219.1 putative family 20 transposase [Serratia marcescens]BEN93401.1 putative family 20 transposase [Serratia marcescens]BEN93453.1 putative family 20 transposase [Serratia marcescens]BEN98737.1 putative family 20 transposase [Serratia marcescens]
MSYIPVGVDIAKHVMQVHMIDRHSGEIIDRQIKRAVFLEFFANREPCLIGMEACGGSQFFARELEKLGHKVRLLPGKFVKAFVMGNKNDVMDARAIWMAVQQPGKSVAVKTEEQQAIMALHKLRRQLVKFRTAQTNAIHGLLLEFGETIRKGRAALDANLPGVLERMSKKLPQALIEMLRDQWHRLSDLDNQIDDIEKQLKTWMKQDEACQKVAAIPGIGPMIATAAVAAMGDAKAFRSGREFAAWLGLVPRQTGTGGRVKLLGISKRGDAYLRTLFIHGARSVMTHSKEPTEWMEQLSQRRPTNVAIVAMANKLARTVWAVLAHDIPYQKGFVSVRPY